MISVYSIDNTDYSKNGNAILQASSCTISEEAGGSYEATVEVPILEKSGWEYLVNAAIIKAPAPVPVIENAYVGQEVYVYRTTTTASLRDGPSESTRITYQTWVAGTGYPIGSKVTNSSYDGHNYQAIAYEEGAVGVNVPPNNNSAWWKRIADYSSGAAEMASLAAGTEVYWIETSGSWYKVTVPNIGLEGYVKTSELEFVRHETVQPVTPARSKYQLFRIYKVVVDNDGMKVTANAKHVSYDLSALLIGDCNLSLKNAPMAIYMIHGAFTQPYAGQIATNLSASENGTYTGDVSWKNGTYAFLDPDKGIVPYFRAKLIRDNWDLYIMKNDLYDRGVRIEYGVNMRGATWTRKIENLITRVIPVAKAEDGSDLFLPDVYEDSQYINNWPVIHTERLAVSGQVGKDDGTNTDTTWTQEALLAEMHTKAQERYTVDHVDAEELSLSVNFLLLGDTAEYAQYHGMQQLYLYDMVKVKDARIGMEHQLQVSAYEWDAVRERYNSIKVGDVFDYSGRTVSGYQIGDGAIYYEKIAPSAIRLIREV